MLILHDKKDDRQYTQRGMAATKNLNGILVFKHSIIDTDCQQCKNILNFLHGFNVSNTKTFTKDTKVSIAGFHEEPWINFVLAYASCSDCSPLCTLRFTTTSTVGESHGCGGGWLRRRR